MTSPHIFIIVCVCVCVYIYIYFLDTSECSVIKCNSCVVNCVKQEDILALTLISIYFAITLEGAFKDYDHGIYFSL